MVSVIPTSVLQMNGPAVPVTHDERWTRYFTQASGTDEMRTMIADSFWRAHYRGHLAIANRPKAIFLEKAPVQIMASKTTSRCKAMNLNNTPCQFKSVCNGFCKKHQIVEE